MSLDLSDLIADGRRAKSAPKKPNGAVWKSDELPLGFTYGRDEKPQAIVLGIIQTICEGCGKVYQYPSQKLMLRYSSRRYTWTHATSDSAIHNHLPHEIVIHEVPCVSCLNCFPAVPLENVWLRRLGEPTIERGGTDALRTDRSNGVGHSEIAGAVQPNRASVDCA